MKTRVMAAALALAMMLALTSCGNRDNSGGSAENGTSNSSSANGSSAGGASAGQVRRYTGREDRQVEMSGVPNANPQHPRSTAPYTNEGRYRAGSDGQVWDSGSTGRDLTRDARDMIRDAGDMLKDAGNGVNNAVRDMTGANR